MEFKVREVTSTPDKGTARVEEELIERMDGQVQPDVQADPEPQSPVDDLDDDRVLSYIGRKYNKSVSSIDELVNQKNEASELPDDVSLFLKYKKETGRGMEDFLKLQQDFDSVNPDSLLIEYFKATEKGLDDDDIQAMLDELKYDEDLDPESDIKKAKLKKKKTIAKAKDYFNEQKEMYKRPLESSRPAVPDEEKEEYEAYKQYVQQAKTFQEEQERKRNWFLQKTNEIFDSEFKGFEFTLNDKKVLFSPGDASEIKKAQVDPSNFIKKFLDENGLIKDANGYHKSLAIAMNPDRFAKFFYEQGVSDATDDIVAKKMKNVNMSERRSPEVVNKGGIQIREVNPGSGRGLKITSSKKS